MCYDGESGSDYVITNEVLRENIIEYVEKYNRKDHEELRNLVYVTKTINGDTTSYFIANACIAHFIWERVNLMTKVDDIYVGYYDEQLNDVKMSVECIVNFMIDDYPHLKAEYREYERRKRKSYDAHPTRAFSFWLLEGEAYILKFVNEELVEKNVFLQS